MHAEHQWLQPRDRPHVAVSIRECVQLRSPGPDRQVAEAELAESSMDEAADAGDDIATAGSRRCVRLLLRALLRLRLLLSRLIQGLWMMWSLS